METTEAGTQGKRRAVEDKVAAINPEFTEAERLPIGIIERRCRGVQAQGIEIRLG